MNARRLNQIAARKIALPKKAGAASAGEIRRTDPGEKNLRADAARLQAILDHNPAVVFVKDRRGRYLDVNRRFEDLFGLKRDRVLGRTDFEIFPRRQALTFRANDRKVLRTGQPLEFEETAKYNDGVHVSLVVKFPLRTHGRIHALCGIATDITPRKRAEEALRLSEERFRLLVNGVKNYAIFLIEPDGTIASWNAGAERLFGYRAEEIIGRHFSIFFKPEDIRRGQPARILRQALRQGRVEREIWRVRKDGVRFLAHVVTTPVRNDAGQLLGFARVLRDLTESRELEAALVEGEEHYHRLFNEAQAMQENLRNLSNRILHVQEEERRRISRELHDEIGQLLTAVSVTLATANAGNFPKRIAGAQQLLGEMMEAVHRFARELRPAVLDELGLLPALRSHIKNFRARTGLPVELRASIVAEQLSSDQKTALFRVAQESLTNIAKHARAKSAAISIQKSGGAIRMEISDDGKSFRPDGKFERRKQRLGLLGMEERVKLVGGEFAIESSPGQGTTVRVSIPFPAAPHLKPK